MMKVGDRLYCWNGDHSEYTIGIYYYIDYILDENPLLYGIRISSNYGDNWFVVSSDNYWYYGKWFYTENEMRKVKLDKLKSVDTI